MSLSRDLISQFIKATNDDVKMPKESTAYGTVKNKDNRLWIQLDGSNILTPLPDSGHKTANVSDGERVIVAIKNHRMVVTGNLDSPSARTFKKNGVTTVEDIDLSKYVKTEVLESDYIVAVNAKIDNLETKLVDADTVIANDLTAINARIDNLDVGEITAGFVRTEYLEANYITASQISGAYATISRLEVSEGKITTLESATANIGDLSTKVGKIDTLIYGSASGNSIHSSFANSVVALVGDAKIKSAMIESINASKITAGDIITNNVAVKSYDGRLVISDETIQISDSSRVRVQIGKDASNDYSIYIWDASGDLMFSGNGITDKAIKSGIIRDDMVSDNADISASKLDIDSLFEVINEDGSNSLKATKVKFDEKGQTLEVAFSNLTSTVQDHGEHIEDHGTRLSVVEGKIESEMWTQDISDLEGKYSTLSTDYSNLTQTVDGISSEVSSNTSRIAGGTNLLTDDHITMYDELKGGGEYYDYSTSTRSLILFQNLYLEPGTYTFSCQVKQLDGSDKPTDIQSRFRIKKNTVSTYYNSNATSGGWTRWSTTIEVTSASDKYDFFLHSYDSANNNVPKLWVKKLKVEKGSFATEDINSRFENAESEISSTKTYINQLSDRISANVAETTNLGTRISTVEQTAAGLTVSVKDAAKTASSYLNHGSSGLVVGDMTASTLGNNILIAADKISIRNNQTVNAIFGSDSIELAKNNSSAIISMLNGRFKIKYGSDATEKGYGIYGITSSGAERLAFQPVNENNNLTIGWGGYAAGANSTNIYGYNMRHISKNDMNLEVGGDLDITSVATMVVNSSGWKINDSGDLFSKYTNGSYLELVGLSSDGNTALGNGGYTSKIGKTHIYGNKIQHIVNTTSGSASYKPYYEAGDSIDLEWYGSGFVSSSGKIVFFTIPLAKPVVGGATPSVKISGSGLRVRQGGNYVYGAASNTHVAASSYNTAVSGDGNFIRIEATMSNNTNAINNDACGIHAKLMITLQ